MRPYNGRNYNLIYPSGRVKPSLDRGVWGVSGSTLGGVYDTTDTTSNSELGLWVNNALNNTLVFMDFMNLQSYSANPILVARNQSLTFSNNRYIMQWSGAPTITSASPGYASLGAVGTVYGTSGYAWGKSFSAGLWARIDNVYAWYGVLFATAYNSCIECRKERDNPLWEFTINRAFYLYCTITYDVWKYYSWTYDGTRVKVFVNGVLANSTGYTGTINPGFDLRIGHGYGDSQIYGDIGLFHFGSYMTDAEVLAQFERTRGRYGV